MSCRTRRIQFLYYVPPFKQRTVLQKTEKVRYEVRVK